jgi:hypothetical protein
MTDAYRHRRKLAWSVRVNRKVVDHVPELLLHGCILHASESARQRTLASGERDVHAWVRGAPAAWCEPPADAVRVTYRPLVESGFRSAAGEIVTNAEAVWLCADGSVVACGLKRGTR